MASASASRASGSIAEVGYRRIGGIDQWVMQFGDDLPRGARRVRGPAGSPHVVTAAVAETFGSSLP